MNHQSHIFPFLWVKGEPINRIKEEIRRIKESNIDEFVVESRTHPQFLEEQWWSDFKEILDYAKELDMKVWLLDDAHFPTGYANGAMKHSPYLRKQYLYYSAIDLYSEGFELTLNLELLRKPKRKWSDRKRSECYYQSLEDNEIQAIIAYPLLENNIVSEDGIDLSIYKSQQFFDCLLPAGTWRVYVIYSTYENGGQADYIDMLQKDSVRLLIDTVYQPHFAYFKEYFGNVFRGFFSDEPGFGNATGFSKDEIIGKKAMALPWSQEIAEILAHDRMSLPFLWATSKENHLSRSIRLNYMNLITDLYSQNFSQQIGNWCRERGIEYIGHIIEDNNMHSRLGTGAGHYFKAMEGQTMAGIDIISSQITIGGDETWRTNSSQNDGQFYHYCLPKLADSSAQLDPVKQFQAFCELYGAYGWQLSSRNMKWILDALLVRGVTNFVPHAFSMASFPDFDSPPHFYANGFNPQFSLFSKLMEYMGKASDIISGGRSTAKIAILYHGELEWIGDYMKIQEPSMILSQAQIDFLYLPSNWLKKVQVNRTGFQLQQHQFEKLIIPQTDRLPYIVYDFIQTLPKDKVIFINEIPEIVVLERGDMPVKMTDYICLDLDNLAQELLTYRLIQADSIRMKLAARQQIKNGEAYLILHNESLTDSYTVELPTGYQQLDIDTGKLSGVSTVQTLFPYQFGIYQYIEESQALDEKALSIQLFESFSKLWEIELVNTKGEKITLQSTKKLPHLGQHYPTFSGTIFYRNQIVLDAKQSYQLIIDRVFDGAIIKLNNHEVATLIAPPYQVQLDAYLKEGHNELEIIVPTTADRQLANEKLFINQFEPMEPIGIVGQVRVVQSN
ncbi:hypothetical protein ABQH43_05850 [Streptococcus sp. ZJ100]|uniref:hypothetical protein n=1 Tax=Streptococcus handemini TaxID=3161188 RepID=UPI0032F0142E